MNILRKPAFSSTERLGPEWLLLRTRATWSPQLFKIFEILEDRVSFLSVRHYWILDTGAHLLVGMGQFGLFITQDTLEFVKYF